MNWPVRIALLFCATSAWARTGFVETRDGNTYEGQVRLETNRLIIANAGQNLLLTVEATNLVGVRFQSDPVAAANRPTPRLADTGTLPAPWRSMDIGDCEITGSATSVSGIFRVRSSGAQIGGERDAFRFVYKPVQGDSEIVARVISVGFTDPAARAGVMMRESLRPDARHALLAVTPARGGIAQSRESVQGGTTQSQVLGVSTPQWIKLKRVGNEFTSHVSRNGTQWRLVEKTTLTMAGDIFVGLAITSMNEYRLNQSVFDQVREAPFFEGAFVPRLELTSGSVVVGRFDFVDETSVKFTGLTDKPAISTPAVARILFQWLPERLAGKIKSGRPGVLLTDGAFLEGEFRGIERGRVQISSVLHGLRTLDVNNEVIAVVFHPLSPKPAAYGVKTTDGSHYAASTVSLAENEVVVQEAALGRWRVPIHELREIRRTIRRD